MRLSVDSWGAHNEAHPIHESLMMFVNKGWSAPVNANFHHKRLTCALRALLQSLQLRGVAA